MGTFDVTLPAGKRVVFPSRCVVCEKQNPDSFIELSFLGADSVSLKHVAVDAAVGLDMDPKYYSSNTHNEVKGIPACKGCVSGLKWYHRRLKFGYYTGWLPGTILLVLGLPAIISIPAILVGAMMPGILTLIFPPTFGASFFNGQANFEFKSETTANEFLQLNSDAVSKKDAPKAETISASSAPETKESI